MNAKQITPKEIQEYIKSNPTLNSTQLSTILNITPLIARGNIAAMKSNITRANKAMGILKPIDDKPKRAYNKKTFTIVKEVSNFANIKGLHKDEARDKIVNEINKSGLTYGKILSLPACQFIIERTIFNKVSQRFTYVGVEYDKGEYFKLLMNLAKEQFVMTPIFGNISEQIFKCNENELSHLILDYCGQLDTFAKEIIYAIQNNIVAKNGIIAITLNRRISLGSGQSFADTIYSDMLGLRNIKEVEKGELVRTALNIFLERICGLNYAIIETFEYCDNKENKKGANMVLAIVKRLR
jgi:hypothetical protein